MPRRRKEPGTVARITFADFNTRYGYEDAESQGAWNAPGSRMTPPMSGRNAFVSLNMNRLNSVPLVQRYVPVFPDILQVAPELPDVLPFLTVPTVTATCDASSAVLTLHNPRAVDCAVQVYIARAARWRHRPDAVSARPLARVRAGVSDIRASVSILAPRFSGSAGGGRQRGKGGVATGPPGPPSLGGGNHIQWGAFHAAFLGRCGAKQTL